jgi:serine/threonine protein kinase
MAELFLARSSGIEGFEKIVVVKRILPRLAAHPEIVRLFLNEARLAATLQHANIVQVYDVGTDEGSYFFAMEYVHGVDARTILKRARARGRSVPPAVALAIVIDLCAGLHYAHERTDLAGRPLNLIHCDVSPSNVLVSYDGAVKLADFGVAKLLGAHAETKLTSQRGKVPYMSPEQCLCQPLDRRSDIFAVAVVLAELLTGQRVFPGKSDYEVMDCILHERLPFERLEVPGLDGLTGVVRRALSRDRDRRQASARELQLELETLARQAMLAISPITVSNFIEDLFEEELSSWRSAVGRGEDLAHHLTGTLPVPLLEHFTSEEPAAEPATALERPSRRPRRRSRRALVLAGALAVGAGAAWLVFARLGAAPGGQPRAVFIRLDAATTPAPRAVAVEPATAPAAPPAAPQPGGAPPLLARGAVASAPALIRASDRTPTKTVSPRPRKTRGAAPRKSTRPWDPEAAAPPP